MDFGDIALAGAAHQAHLIRDGEVSSRELVELYLERIERIDPELNSYRVVLGERALRIAGEADRRRARGEEAPLLGVPLAIKDNLDLAGEVTSDGTTAHGGPAERDAEIVRRLRRRRRDPRKDEPPGAGDHGLDGVADEGRHSQPVGHRPDPGGLERRLRRRGRRRPRRRGSRLRRRGLDPHPGGELRPVRAEAPARARVAHAAFEPLERDERGGGPGADRGGHGAPPRRHERGGRRRRSRGAAAPTGVRELARERPPRLRVALSLRPSLPVPVASDVRRAVEETAALLRSLGHEVTRRDPAYNEIGTVVTPRYLKGIQHDAERMSRPERLQRRTRGSRGSAAPSHGRSSSVPSASSAPGGAHQPRLRRQRRPADTGRCATAGRSGRMGGDGRHAHPGGNGDRYPYPVVWNVTGQPAASAPAGFTADGLPLGVQLVGRPNDEGLLLSPAAELEAERPWADRRPPIA